MYIINFSLIYSLPPYISLKERVEECPIIIIGNIEIIKTRELFQEIQYITLYVENIKVLKNTPKAIIPEEFYIYLNVYPETFENKLKFIPEEGKYIVFLEPSIKNNEIIVYKLYREEPFALESWTKEKEEEIIHILKENNKNKDI